MLSHMSIGKALGRFGRFGRLRIAARLALAAALLFPLTSLECPAVAQVQPVRGEMTMSTTGGYGRLVVRLDVEMETEVRISSGVLIVQFKRPVDIAVDRITAGAGQYFGAARRDPDGKAVRFALQQKLKVSTMTAGERLFVDLLARKLDRRAARIAARGRRGPGPPRPRGRPPGAAEARARSAAPRSGGAGAGREPVDLHALHLRAAGADAGQLRALQGQADAELRRDICGSICRTPSSRCRRRSRRSTPTTTAASRT